VEHDPGVWLVVRLDHKFRALWSRSIRALIL